jgi:hypothetical protein
MAVIVIIWVAGIAQAVTVGVRSIVGRIIRAVRTVVTAVTIHVPAGELIERLIVSSVVYAVIVIIWI